jgi:hypothetical protein
MRCSCVSSNAHCFLSILDNRLTLRYDGWTLASETVRVLYALSVAKRPKKNLKE